MSNLAPAKAVPIRSTPQQRRVLIWTRQTGIADNVIFMTDKEIVITTLALGSLAMVREALLSGQPISEVLGPRTARIPHSAVRSISTVQGSLVLTVAYRNAEGKGVSRCVTTANGDAQAHILAEARKRIPRGADIRTTTSNRWRHAVKPISLLVALLLMAVLAHYHLMTNRNDVSRAIAASINPGGPAVADGATRSVPERSGTARITSIAVGAVAVITLVLDALGYQWTLTVLMGGALAAFGWSLMRLTHPPVIIRLVACSQDT